MGMGGNARAFNEFERCMCVVPWDRSTSDASRPRRSTSGAGQAVRASWATPGIMGMAVVLTNQLLDWIVVGCHAWRLESIGRFNAMESIDRSEACHAPHRRRPRRPGAGAAASKGTTRNGLGPRLGRSIERVRAKRGGPDGAGTSERRVRERSRAEPLLERRPAAGGRAGRKSASKPSSSNQQPRTNPESCGGPCGGGSIGRCPHAWVEIHNNQKKPARTEVGILAREPRRCAGSWISPHHRKRARG